MPEDRDETLSWMQKLIQQNIQANTRLRNQVVELLHEREVLINEIESLQSEKTNIGYRNEYKVR